jgi:hypothetical protein
LILADWSHVLAEAHYDDRWHYLDVDVRAAFRRPDGSLASFEESRTDHRLWRNRGPLFFPNDDLEHVRKIYAATPFVEIDATGASLSISLDNGISWQPVSTTNGSKAFDLTKYVASTYGYLLRVDLRGVPESAVVRKLSITTWVQVAPAALPSLRAGSNRMAFRLNDHHGLPSRVVAVCSDSSKPNELRKLVVRMPDDYDPSRKTARIRGELIAKVVPPPGTSIAWFTAEGSFRTYQQEAAANTRNTIGYTVGAATDFAEIYQSDVPTDMGHWHFNASREVRLDKPANELYVRYFGDPALNNFKIYAHCLDDRLRQSSPAVVTHTWTENGVEKSKRFRFDSADEYEIVAGANPIDKSIEIAVPSDGFREVAVEPQPVRSPPPSWVESMRRS